MTTPIGAAITPMVCISANSLILLTLSNRYSSLTARIRQVDDVQQVSVIYIRILIMKSSLVLDIASICLQVILVLGLLTIQGWQTLHDPKAVGLFGSSLIFMLGSLLVFLTDIFMSSMAVSRYVARLRTNEDTGVSAA
jgi:hypothetical protein